MSKLNIKGTVGGNFSTFTVDGVDGYFKCVSRNTFCKVQHWFPGAPGGYVLVCNVSDGITGEGGLTPCPSKSKNSQILNRLERYLDQYNISTASANA